MYTVKIKSKLYYLGPAELRSSPKSIQVKEDEQAIMTCTFKGLDPPITQILWFKDGEQLKDNGLLGRYRITENPGISNLIIKNAHINDKGKYHCEIITKGYSPIKSKLAILTINEKLKFSPEPVSRILELNSTAKVLFKKFFLQKKFLCIKEEMINCLLFFSIDSLQGSRFNFTYYKMVQRRS